MRSVAGLFDTWTQAGPMRLSLSFAMLIVVGFGTTTIYPEWFVRQHAVPVGDASKHLLAWSRCVMVPGGLARGCAAGARLA